MLVRSMPHQTQIVVLEGPVLVEHYVARSDKTSLVGNVYLGKVRNVLPGMEAAFIDFGAGKNGVLYAGDVNYGAYDLNGKPKRIESALSAGDPVLVQVVKDAMGHKGARLTNQISLAGRYLVLAPDPQVRGISRRLSDDERRRLRELVAELRPEGMGVIVRTAAEGASRDDIKSDIDRLSGIWEGIVARREVGVRPVADLSGAAARHPGDPGALHPRLQATARRHPRAPTTRSCRISAAPSPTSSRRSRSTGTSSRCSNDSTSRISSARRSIARSGCHRAATS